MNPVKKPTPSPTNNIPDLVATLRAALENKHAENLMLLDRIATSLCPQLEIEQAPRGSVPTIAPNVPPSNPLKLQDRRNVGGPSIAQFTRDCIASMPPQFTSLDVIRIGKSQGFLSEKPELGRRVSSELSRACKNGVLMRVGKSFPQVYRKAPRSAKEPAENSTAKEYSRFRESIADEVKAKSPVTQ
jgi:hypothetical protein